MSSTPAEWRSRCEELCDALVDGRFTPAQKMELERLVLQNAEARRYYVERMHLHAALRRELGAGAPPLTETLKPRQARRLFTVVLLPAMLALGIVLAGVWTRAPRAVATLTAVQNARWEGSSLPTTVGTRLPPGQLKLAGGLATLTFDSGAEVVLEGPALLDVTSSRECVLHTGGLVARVPPPAVGFTVRAGSVILIDHGTEFGVTAAPAGETQVEVLSGLVEARHAASAGNVLLKTGDAMVFRGDGAQPRSPAAGEPRTGAVKRSTPADLTLTTASGRGQAVSVHSRPHADDILPEGLVLVKNTEDIEWQRKVYLAFDLAPLAGRGIADASLAVTVVPTGMGHATFVPDATFAVYGVEDPPEGLQRITWETAPGNGPGGAGVAGTVLPIGTFVVPQGVSTGTFTVQGPNLTDFLARDHDGTATFLLVRQTAELRRNGLVHGFSGNHHPTAAPPTLRLSLR